ncbi:hypothetical protein HDU89_005074 [Geranomyces variabilis]|nr:hypothetical protein HDU89_005074 [Geranomyces variabilis]
MPDHTAVNVGGAGPGQQRPTGKFAITADQMYDLIDPKNPEEYANLGGLDGLLEKLHVDKNTGLKSSGGGGVSQPSSSSSPPPPKDEEGAVPHAQPAKEARDPDDGQERRDAFGANELPEPVSKTLVAFMIDALKDKTLIVLCIAAVVEIAIGIYEAVGKGDSLGIIDGFAIVVAVLIVVLVASVNDFRKQAQFRKLNDFSKSLSGVKVLRNSETVTIPTKSLLVGDICIVETGDVLPADGLLVQGFSVETDESSLTGEPVNIRKDLKDDPFMLSGTKVVNGTGKMLVIGCGMNSMNGRTMLALEVEPEETPLQAKLSALADQIAKFGVAAASLMVIVLLIAYFAITKGKNGGDQTAHAVINIFITAITLVVVAVPEGLPLAVTLALAHATGKMLADNNLVRHLSACETMGNATTICSDKTGTLTVNKMTVTAGQLAGIEFAREDLPDALKKRFEGAERLALLQLMCLGVNINSTASRSKNREGEMAFNGSKTEIALLNMTHGLGYPYAPDRENTHVVDVAPFSSERKRMSTVIEIDHNQALESQLQITNAPAANNGKRFLIHVKGASEIILRSCDSYIAEDGTIKPLSDDVRKKFEALIESYAEQALRTIGAAFKPISHSGVASTEKHEEGVQRDDEHGLTFFAVFGIQDPVREEVPGAVKQCQDAGIRIRMVTGDNLVTAKAIATECNIYTEGGVAMEGPAFRKLTQDEMDEVLPKLQVLARSSPLDKQILVRNLKRLGETVAVTGDGTNDAPALKGSDVGFSMGITGTEVAKEASDIVILDDNFASIVKAVLWGRSVFDSVRKFLEFQLTVNVSAVIITIVTSVHTTIASPRNTPSSALTAVQLLWVNLIMDTLAALALATDPPTPELLQRKPSRRSERLVNFHMARQIIGQAIYQIVLCLVVYFYAETWFPNSYVASPDPNAAVPDYINKETGQPFLTSTLVFNTFVFCQVFNEINARSISKDLNIFKGILKNRIFQTIIVATVVLQAIIVQFGGPVFKTEGGLTGLQWVVCLVIGLGSLPVGVAIRLLPDWRKTRDEDDDPRTANLRDDIELEEKSHGEMPQKSTAQLVPGGRGGDGEVQKPDGASDKSETSDRWTSAIRATQMQIRVVNAFQLPQGARAVYPQDGTGSGGAGSTTPQLRRPVHRSDTARSAELWSRARAVPRSISVVNAFRGGRRRNDGVMGLQMMDADRAREQRPGSRASNRSNRTAGSGR